MPEPNVTITVNAENETIRFWTVVARYVGRIVRRDWHWLTKSGDSWTAAKGLLGLLFVVIATVFIVVLLIKGARSLPPSVVIVVSVGLIAMLLLSWFIPAAEGTTIRGKEYSIVLNAQEEAIPGAGNDATEV